MNKKDHQAEAESHIAQGKNFAKLSDHLSTAADSMSENESGADALRSGSECCKAISDQHISDGSRHLDCMKAEPDEIEKVDGDEQADIKELLTGVRQLLRSVVPSNVSALPRVNNQFVIRQGQRTAKEIQEEEAAIKAVSPELSDVLFAKQAAQ